MRATVTSFSASDRFLSSVASFSSSSRRLATASSVAPRPADSRVIASIFSRDSATLSRSPPSPLAPCVASMSLNAFSCGEPPLQRLVGFPGLVAECVGVLLRQFEIAVEVLDLIGRPRKFGAALAARKP